MEGSPGNRTVVIRVFDALMRDIMASWLTSLSGYLVVGAVSAGPALTRLCALRSPDVALVQLGSAGAEDLDLLRGLRKLRPAPHVIGLHGELDPEKLLLLHRAGVRRLVANRCGVAALRSALEETRPGPPAPRTNGALSGRELEILALISAGCSTVDVADALGISPHTVINHTRRIFTKLDVHSRMQAAAEAGRLGLRGERSAPPRYRLTPRERDILDSIALGHSVRETANALGIAVKTVQSEQRQLFAKLGVRNRPSALAYARDQGLIET